jgi:hypothetical protein
MKKDTLKLVYFEYFYPVTSYKAIVWENSTDSKRVFNIEKKIIINIANIYVNAVKISHICIGIVSVLSVGIQIMTCSTLLACNMKNLWNVNKFYSILFYSILFLHIYVTKQFLTMYNLKSMYYLKIHNFPTMNIVLLQLSWQFTAPETVRSMLLDHDY